MLAQYTARLELGASLNIPDMGKAMERLSTGKRINNAGDVVGQFTDAGNVNHGFLLSGGKFTQIDFPGSVSTLA